MQERSGYTQIHLQDLATFRVALTHDVTLAKSMCMAHAHAGIKGKSWWQDGGTMGFMLQVLSWKSNLSYLIIKYSKPRKLRSIPVRPCPSMFCFSCQATNTFCRSTSTTSWDDKRPDQYSQSVVAICTAKKHHIESHIDDWKSEYWMRRQKG